MILVTGATGQIGREVVRLLARDHVPFRAFVRDTHRARDVLDTPVELVPGDLADPTSLDRALRDVDTLFVVSNNPALELGAVDAAIRQGVRRIVKSSAVGFRDQPPPGHREVETAIRHSGLAYTSYAL